MTFPIPTQTTSLTLYTSPDALVQSTTGRNESWSNVKHPQGWIYFYNASRRQVIDKREHKGFVPWEIDDDLEAYVSFLPDGKQLREEVSHREREVYDFPPRSNISTNNDEARMRYWRYIANHPSHNKSPIHAHDEAMSLLRWCTVGEYVCISKTQLSDWNRVTRGLFSCF